jgi:hypothetical protein
MRTRAAVAAWSTTEDIMIHIISYTVRVYGRDKMLQHEQKFPHDLPDNYENAKRHLNSMERLYPREEGCECRMDCCQEIWK